MNAGIVPGGVEPGQLRLAPAELDERGVRERREVDDFGGATAVATPCAAGIGAVAETTKLIRGATAAAGAINFFSKSRTSPTISAMARVRRSTPPVMGNSDSALPSRGRLFGVFSHSNSFKRRSSTHLITIGRSKGCSVEPLAFWRSIIALTSVFTMKFEPSEAGETRRMKRSQWARFSSIRASQS